MDNSKKNNIMNIIIKSVMYILQLILAGSAGAAAGATLTNL